MRRLLAVLLLTAACDDGDTPPCDGAADEAMPGSASEDSSSDESSTGESLCEDAYDACKAAGTDHWDCVDAYVKCDPLAAAAWDVCTSAVETCVWNCCPYPDGSGAQTTCVLETQAACIDTCGFYSDCDPFPDDAD